MTLNPDRTPTLPLDEPDVKCNGEGLGLMTMSPAVRLGLNVLRVYLFAMMIMLAYHVLDLAGTFGHHASP